MQFDLRKILKLLIVALPATIFLLVSSFPNVYAQQKDIVTIPVLSGSIKLDGLINEDAWERLTPLPLVMSEPVFRGEMNEETEIRIAHDDKYIYVSGRFYDSDPSGIRNNSLYRDRYSGDDVFSIALDTFNDEENALWFFTTPEGVRIDVEVSNDADFSRGSVLNYNWNTFWEVKTSRDSNGWYAEMRIPFTSLGFQSTGGDVKMGLIVYRLVSRKNERYTYPEISPDYNLGFAKPSIAQKVTLKNVTAEKPFYLIPYALAGFNQSSELNQVGDAYETNQSLDTELGLDAKYNVTSNLTLDLTVNTDFAQAEADNQQINLSRFSLFFPEQRQFFQERSSTFDFNTGGFDRVFFSRQIGLDQASGESVRILGGARLSGRIGDWGVGFLNMQTERRADLNLPSENFNVIRLNRDAFNSNSRVGGIITSRLGDDGSYNYVLGLDTDIRVVDDEYISVKVVESFDDEIIDNNENDFSAANLVRIQWSRRKQQGFNYDFVLSRSGENYRPDIGFVTRSDFTELRTNLRYGIFNEDSPVRFLNPQFRGFIALRNTDQSIESAEIAQSWNFGFRSGAFFNAGLFLSIENLRNSLSFPNNSVVPTGSYKFYGFGAGFSSSEGNLFRINTGTTIGSFYDGWQFNLGFNPVWNVSKYLELDTQIALDVVEFPDRDQRFESLILRLRGLIAFNTKLSMAPFIQVSTINDRVGLNTRLRYNFSEGFDIWLVYNDQYNLDRERLIPTLPVTNNRAILFKITRAFKL